ncbi:MAG: hypothetical protein Kow0074_23450 [Candidatus Zixiibacteriota bacterium]
MAYWFGGGTMTTITESKQNTTDTRDQELSPTDDELLARDLPRPGVSDDDQPVVTPPQGSIKATDTPHKSGRIRPVELGTSTSQTKTADSPTPSDKTDPFRGTAGAETPPVAPETKSPPTATPEKVNDAVLAPIPDISRPSPAGQPQNIPSVRMTGQTLRFPSGVSLIPGRTVSVNGVSFEIKPEEAFKGMFWAKSIGVMVITLLAAIGVAYLLSGPDPGALTGVVINARTGTIVPHANVALGDERMATTNEAGLYVFDNVAAEQYVLTAAAPGFVAQNGFIEIEGGETEQLSFALEPIAAVVPEATPDSSALADVRAEESARAEKKRQTTSTAPSYGSVNLDVDFTGYLVFVDGELYGKNTDKLKRLTEGEHRVLLQLEGYEDYTANVTVKARNASTLKVTKSDLKPRVDPIKRSRGHFAKGKTLIEGQEWTAAIREFNEALQYDPEYAEALQYRGWVYLKTENPSLAMADFTRAANLFDKTRRYIDAVACAKYMIEISPKDPSHWRRRGDYNLALADYQKAIADYEEAVKLGKKSLDNRLALAEALYAAGEYKDAAKEFDRARKLADDPSHAYIRMILAYYNAGERNNVVKKYEDFAGVASPELMTKLRNDPEWLKVLQMVGPDERLKN